jgi:hypothetical protein
MHLCKIVKPEGYEVFLEYHLLTDGAAVKGNLVVTIASRDGKRPHGDE